MHFDEDNEYDSAPEQGDTLIFDTGDGGEIELGPATLDTDGDGEADSLIVVESGQAYLVSDVDGDGYVDQVQENPNVSGAPDEDEDDDDKRGDNRTGRDSNRDEDDDDDQDGTVVQVDRNADDLMPTAPGSALDDLPDTGDDRTDPGPVVQPVDDTTNRADDVMVIETEGEVMELGEPTLDSNGDGTADTVVTELEDGSLITFTDRDGDGDADQITAFGTDGTIEVAEPDGRGGWEPVARGHVTPDGEVVLEEI